MKILFRFDGYDHIYCYQYNIVAETAKGVWISFGSIRGKDKWISNTSRKRFAYPTKGEAFESFVKRKQKQKKILEAQLLRVNKAISITDEKGIDCEGWHGESYTLVGSIFDEF